jgi:hypothetical protein
VLAFLAFQFEEIFVQAIETLFPETAVAFGPVRDFFLGTSFEAAGPPLGFAGAGDETAGVFVEVWEPRPHPSRTHGGAHREMSKRLLLWPNLWQPWGRVNSEMQDH